MKRYVTKESVEGLIRKLNLPAGDSFTQDWEFEIASSDIAVNVLCSYMNRKDLNSDEKFTLMRLILESVNGYLDDKGVFPLINELEEAILTDYIIHESTIEEFSYWESDNPDEYLTITPIIRSIAKKNNKSS